jgi:hypothetical protein
VQLHIDVVVVDANDVVVVCANGVAEVNVEEDNVVSIA